MNHSFNVEIATKLNSVEKAILIENIAFWLIKDKANNKNFYDGYYWTYNSSESFAKLFPYMKSSSIRRWLKELENDGILTSGNYNKTKYDQTKWYTIKDEWILSFYELPLIKMSNGDLENEQPIPDINTDINIYNVQENKKYNKSDIISLCETKAKQLNISHWIIFNDIKVKYCLNEEIINNKKVYNISDDVYYNIKNDINNFIIKEQEQVPASSNNIINDISDIINDEEENKTIIVVSDKNIKEEKLVTTYEWIIDNIRRKLKVENDKFYTVSNTDIIKYIFDTKDQPFSVIQNLKFKSKQVKLSDTYTIFDFISETIYNTLFTDYNVFKKQEEIGE